MLGQIVPSGYSHRLPIAQNCRSLNLLPIAGKDPPNVAPFFYKGIMICYQYLHVSIWAATNCSKWFFHRLPIALNCHRLNLLPIARSVPPNLPHFLYLLLPIVTSSFSHRLPIAHSLYLPPIARSDPPDLSSFFNKGPSKSATNIFLWVFGLLPIDLSEYFHSPNLLPIA